MPFAAIGVGSLLSVAAPIVGSIFSSNAASNAADSQSQAANNATAVQQGMFDKTQANLSPYMKNGAQNLSSLQGMLDSGQLGGKFTNADLNANMAPNYAFQLQQGQQALQNSQSAKDGVLSGSAMKDMQNFTQNTASGAYQNAYSNWLSTQNLQYGQRANLASLGENSAANLGNAGVQTGQAIGNNITGAANAQAASSIAGANAVSSGLSNAAGYYQLSNMLGGSNSVSNATLDGGTMSNMASNANFTTNGTYGFGGGPFNFGGVAIGG